RAGGAPLPSGAVALATVRMHPPPPAYNDRLPRHVPRGWQSPNGGYNPARHHRLAPAPADRPPRPHFGARRMTIDLERPRRETPGVDAVHHLNNAGAALMPATVRKAVTDHLELEARIGGYEAADRAEAALEEGV